MNSKLPQKIHVKAEIVAAIDNENDDFDDASCLSPLLSLLLPQTVSTIEEIPVSATQHMPVSTMPQMPVYATQHISVSTIV